MALARDPKNVVPVVDGEVLVSFAEAPTIALDGTPSEEWDTLGILTDGSRVELNRTVDRTKTNGWGFGVVATTAKPGDLTAAAETLEDNEVTRRIAFPHRKAGEGEVVDGHVDILYHSDEVARPFVALVERMQDGKLRIRASRYPAVATMEDLGFGSEVAGKTVNFDFEPGPNKDVFDELYLTDAGVSEVNEDIVLRFGDAA